uniref:Uncharacterized protein n=1 Tax=Sphaerodactylus townsendi TaxID=933632 RepID=A0ACB8F8P8_9SAUR
MFTMDGASDEKPADLNVKGMGDNGEPGVARQLDEDGKPQTPTEGKEGTVMSPLLLRLSAVGLLGEVATHLQTLGPPWFSDLTQKRAEFSKGIEVRPFQEINISKFKAFPLNPKKCGYYLQ